MYYIKVPKNEALLIINLAKDNDFQITEEEPNCLTYDNIVLNIEPRKKTLQISTKTHYNTSKYSIDKLITQIKAGEYFPGTLYTAVSSGYGEKVYLLILSSTKKTVSVLEGSFSPEKFLFFINLLANKNFEDIKKHALDLEIQNKILVHKESNIIFYELKEMN